jgi:hypothetical protein
MTSPNPERKHEAGPDAPMPDRIESSPAVLAERVREVARAFHAADEPAARLELRALAREASLLAAMDPLLPSMIRNRQRVSAEREPTGRGAS